MMDERFYTEFTYSEALPREEGVTRRDVSPVILVDGTYYAWYSKATVDSSGYFAAVWYATSADGHVWTEQGEALSKGAPGAFDEHAVFTPTILVAEGRYYLFYTAVPEPFTNDDGGPGGTKTAIGVAVADHPEGPFARFEGNPVLRTGESGFDSHRVDDACFVVRDGKYFMYYKGRELGKTPRETKMGLAVADGPTGPYRKHPENPIIGSGHEVCVWPHGEGVATILQGVGPEGKTVQYGSDGVHFEVKARLQPPGAPGPFRADNFRDEPGPGITWGLSHDTSEYWPCIVRFDCDLRAER